MNTATAKLFPSTLDPSAPSPARVVDSIPLIPLRKKLHGPLVARRLRLFYAIQIGAAALGMLPVAINAAPQWRAFGLGLVFPGAGFLFAGGPLGIPLAVAAFALFMVSLFLWWARGILPLPGLTLVCTAALSAWLAGSHAPWLWVQYLAPTLLIAFYFTLHMHNRRAFKGALERARATNSNLPGVEPLLRNAPVSVRPEMTPAQLAEFRRQLDLALQPIESWNGFLEEDKWQERALRYQICTPTWNLAMTQYSQLPAFHGYLNTAQHNLILKHIHRKTWDYWRYESLWGNLSYERDPIRIDNIMLSGFLGVSLGMFESASGTSPFSAPGSLTFQWDDNLKFEYSHSSLCQRLVENFKRYDLGWFVCEPRWIYSMCNLVGRNALLFHDNRHGTNFSDQIAGQFDKTMTEEMLLADGRIRVCTSSLFGFTVPTLSGLFGEAWGIRFLTSYAPQDAERLWEILKREFIGRDASGAITYKLMDLGWDTRRPSDFRKWDDINPLVVTLWAALEMGDSDLVRGIGEKLDEKYGAGTSEALTYGKANTIRDMVNTGLPEAWRTGPILSDATYPDVIVGHAVTDGQALDLVLHPGQGPVSTAITLGRLRPLGRYRIKATGAEFVASERGEAELKLAVHSRTELNIVPVT